MWQQLAFTMAVAFIFTHELYAVKRHEWRIMPLLNRISDKTGFTVFVLGHIPIFGLLVWVILLPRDETTNPLQIAISAFCIIHVLLHKLYQNHPANEFNNPLSQLLIWGAGIAGAGHILLAII